MKIKFDHVNLTVGNLTESIQWYQRVFGFELVEKGISHDNKPWVIVAHDDHMICMKECKDRKEASSFDDETIHQIYHFGIRVSDGQEWQEKVKRFNLQLYYGGVIEYPHSKSWYIHDPSGHEIEVSYSGDESLRFPNHQNL